MIFDVSIGVSPRTPIWPGGQRPAFTVTHQPLPGGNETVATRLDMIAHSGTHIDAPLHFRRNGQTIDAVELGKLMGPCRVFEHRGPGHIGRAELDEMGFSPVRRALFRTANSARLHTGVLGADYISFLDEAIDVLIHSGVEVLGIDGFSIGPYGEMSDTNHVAFCGAGGLIIEMLDLTSVAPGDYLLVALPLKLEGVEAAPSRVLLMREEDLDGVFGKQGENG
ncbi:MAG: cyclase family protein [Spirochaetia bacterium]|jgi:arylformamidase